MASSCGDALKGAMVVAVWVVLLHSSTGQQPPVPAPATPPVPASPPPPDCSNCSSICTPSCEDIVAGNHAIFCRDTVVPSVYRWCLGDCANSTCDGHSSTKITDGVLDCCSIGTCTPQHCGKPCLQDCCKSCTAKANAAYDGCSAGNSGGSSKHSCMDGCMNNCKQVCISH